MRWCLSFLLFLLVVPALAQDKVPVASRFIAGEWRLTCSSTGLPGGVVIQGNRISSGEFGWGCVFLELTEVKPTGWDYGPAWTFRARCDMAPDKSAGPGSPSGLIAGTIELRYRDGDRKRTELRLGIDKPAERGGLLNMFPQSTMSFIRCAE